MDQQGPKQARVFDIPSQLMLAHHLLALDEAKVRAHLQQTGDPCMVAIAARQGDPFTAFMHCTRIQLINASPAQRRESEEWLRSRMYPVPAPNVHTANK